MEEPGITAIGLSPQVDFLYKRPALGTLSVMFSVQRQTKRAAHLSGVAQRRRNRNRLPETQKSSISNHKS